MDGFVEELGSARDEHVRLLESFVRADGARLGRLAETCATALAAGGKLLFFGNGGSAALAQELAAELVNRYERPRSALAALALTADGAVLTSVSNDSAFDEIFSRQIEALGRPGDVALGISTSGASPNLVRGLRTARRLGLFTAALLGRDGGPAAAVAEVALVVPGTHTGRIQEVQMFAAHQLCRRVEQLLSFDGERATPPLSAGRPVAS